VIVIKVSGSLAVSCHPGSGRVPSEEAGLRTRAELTGAKIVTERRWRFDLCCGRLETSHVGRKGLRYGY
jgi:hypothetical protein